MLKLRNQSIEKVIKEDRSVICFGTGALFDMMLTSYQEMNRLVTGLLDNNCNIQGTEKRIGDRTITVMSPLSADKEYLKGKILIITPVFFTNIIEKLDSLQCFDGMETYIYPFMTAFDGTGTFPASSTQDQRIPKTIHYCWFGGGALPEALAENVRKWKDICSDYEIIRWDETNYDVTRCKYMKDAYDRKLFTFVSDYARKDIIQQCGGIYLDTDVEMIKSFDSLLYNEAFMGLDDAANINSGSGFGSVAHNDLLQKFIDDYEDIELIRPDGSINAQPCGVYETRLAIRHGFVQKNQYQKIGNMVIYPREVLSPYSWMGLEDNYTENTYSIHRFKHLIGNAEPIARREEITKIMDRMNRF